MRATIYKTYGSPDVLQFAELEEPQAGPGEVQVQVRASAVTTADWRLRASAFPGITWLPGRLMFGLFRPRNPVLGGVFSGVVNAVGAGVTEFEPGDNVFGFCVSGAHAETLVMPADGAISRKPAGLSHAEAAAVPFGARSALVFLRDFARIGAGDRLMVVGASGGVGAYAVQIARHMGAQVTGVASAGSADLIRSLGAVDVLDYKSADWPPHRGQWDAILDTVGASQFRQMRRNLSGQGIYVPLNFGLREAVQALWTGLHNGRKVRIGVNEDNKADLEEVVRLLETGALRPVVDRVLPFDRIREAYEAVETRHSRGAVVLDMSSSDRMRIAA